MQAAVKNELHRVTLAITNGPILNDIFESRAQVLGVTITYANRAVSAILLELDSMDMYVDPADVESPKRLPAWLRSLLEEHQPARPTRTR